MQGDPTLHAELAAILHDAGNAWLSVTELTTSVNERGRYRTRLGAPVARLSVDMRTRRYSELFERRGSSVRLRIAAEGAVSRPVSPADERAAAARPAGGRDLNEALVEAAVADLETPPVSGPHKLRLPRLESVELNRFSLYRNRADIAATFDGGVFCLAGANGLGKSTFLSAIAFGLTGIVADPNRKFDSLSEYYNLSLPYSASYFGGRIGEFDRDAASITITFKLNDRRYVATRGMFEPQSLRGLTITDGEGARVRVDVASDEERHLAYVDNLLADSGLSTFEQFVFLHHFLFTFDERRHLLFWDERVAEQALYIAFGIDTGRAAQADKWRRQAERNDSQARNNQYQATAARQQLEDVRRRSQEAPVVDESLVLEHQRLIEARDEAASRVASLRAEVSDALLEFESATSERSASLRQYDDAFSDRLAGTTSVGDHPIIRAAIETHRCPICSTDEPAVAERLKDRIAAHECPLCGSVLSVSEPDAGSMDALRGLDAALRDATARVEAASKTRARLDAEISEAQAAMDQLSDEVEALEAQNETLRPGAVAGIDGSVDRLVRQYQQEIGNALKRKDAFRARQHEAVANLRSVQQELRAAYAEAELEFVPRFAGLARSFLGLDLEVGLGPREGSIGLVLTIEQSRRRDVDQLSESQRYFIEIALRMALVQHMIAAGEQATLYIDTPEGSLDIAYESRAGDMFGSFVAEGNRIVMTANINTSQLLQELARRCGRARMQLLRMTDWTSLSDVQVQAEHLFDDAYEQIEAALAEGPQRELA